MNEWFSELATLEKIYWVIAVVASLFFIIQMISVFVMGDLDVQIAGDTDFDIETDSGIPFQFFTLRNLVGFFTVFAWVGLACIDADYSNNLTLIISSASGLIMMAIMSTLFYFVSQMTDSGTMNINNAKGKIATVYIPIKAKRSNMGKVQIKIQSSLRELDAITDEEEDLQTSSIVKVIDIINDNVLLVEKSK
jgi:hypothetical protein